MWLVRPDWFSASKSTLKGMDKNPHESSQNEKATETDKLKSRAYFIR